MPANSTPLTKRVAVADSATAIVGADDTRKSLYISNEDASAIVRIGPSGLTDSATAATCGLAIPPSTIMPVIGGEGSEDDAKHAYYGITETGTVNVSVMEIFG